MCIRDRGSPIKDAREMNDKNICGLIMLEYGEGLIEPIGIDSTERCYLVRYNSMSSRDWRRDFELINSKDLSYLRILDLIKKPGGQLTIWDFEKGLSDEQKEFQKWKTKYATEFNKEMIRLGRKWWEPKCK